MKTILVIINRQKIQEYEILVDFYYSHKWISNIQEQNNPYLSYFSHLFSSPSLECLLFSHDVSEKNRKDFSYKEYFQRPTQP